MSWLQIPNLSQESFEQIRDLIMSNAPQCVTTMNYSPTLKLGQFNFVIKDFIPTEIHPHSLGMHLEGIFKREAKKKIQEGLRELLKDYFPKATVPAVIAPEPQPVIESPPEPEEPPSDLTADEMLAEYTKVASSLTREERKARKDAIKAKREEEEQAALAQTEPADASDETPPEE